MLPAERVAGSLMHDEAYLTASTVAFNPCPNLPKTCCAHSIETSHAGVVVVCETSLLACKKEATALS